jgi:hypothetical protein
LGEREIELDRFSDFETGLERLRDDESSSVLAEAVEKLNSISSDEGSSPLVLG